MHEYGIVQSLLERVEAEARAHGATMVHRIRLELGELSGVDGGLLQAAYETFRERGPCAGAELDIVPVAAAWKCPGCGRPIPRGRALRCEECGFPARLEAGEEIVLARIEMEVP